MEATYRFCGNKKVNPDNILEPHRAATIERVRQHKVVLLVQDTTEIDLTRPSEQVDGAGPLQYETRQGGFYHPLLAFAEDGLALGNVWSKSWVRTKINTKMTPTEKANLKRHTPFEAKESFRWLEGFQQARKLAGQCPGTQFVCIGDSESDIYDLFLAQSESSVPQVNLLVRACHDRLLVGGDQKLAATVRASECLYTCRVDVSGRKQKMEARTAPRRQSRDARTANMEVRARAVTLKAPYRATQKLDNLRLNAVLVEEPTPEDGQVAIQWLLLTTLPIDTAEQVQSIVQHYCIRWQIEIYFRTLKSGCRIQERYFERMDRTWNCLAIYSVIAWQILYLCRLGRECPDLACNFVFTTSEWQAVYAIVHPRKIKLPESPPTLNEMIRWVASLGGYVIRPKTHPGTQTLWLGLQRLHDLSNAWNTFGPESKIAEEFFYRDTCVVQ